MTSFEQAAELRAAAMKAPADRPSERHAAGSTKPGVKVRLDAPQFVERQAENGADAITFTGYASVTERGYEMWDMFGPYTEVVSRGAFADTLSRGGLDVPLVLSHDSLRRLARTTNGTLRLSEDDQGLLVEADMDPADADVAYILPKLRSGLIDEMSFRFSIDAGQWSPDYTEFRINAADINRGDVAIVGYGANPATVAAVRADTDPLSVVRGMDVLTARAAYEILRPLFTSRGPVISDEDTRHRVR